MQSDVQHIKENKPNHFRNIHSKKASEVLPNSKENYLNKKIVYEDTYASISSIKVNEFSVDLFLENTHFEKRNHTIVPDENNQGLLLVDSWWRD